MLAMENLRKQMRETERPYVRQIGAILLRLAEGSGKIAELIEQDLAVPEMSLEACGKALLAYARKNQEKGFWGCGFELDKDNPVFKIIFDFYKIPSDWVFEPDAGETPPSAFAPPTSKMGADRCGTGGGTIDLMDLL